MPRRPGIARPFLVDDMPAASNPGYGHRCLFNAGTLPTLAPTAARAPRRVRRRPTWLYLLTHVHRTRFKIGYSGILPTRLAELGPAQLDPTACWCIELPDRHTAEGVERSLHRFLAPYRLRDLPARDGSTEWFAIGAIAVALDLMRSVPMPARTDGAPLRFVPLRRLCFDAPTHGAPVREVDVAVTVGSPGWVPSAWMRAAPQVVQVQHRVGELAALVEVMATWWPLEWHPVDDPGAATASAVTVARAWRLGLVGDLLVVKGMRRRPGFEVDEIDYHSMRSRVIDAATWELMPGRPASSVVATIDYGRVERDDLLLRLRPRAVLRSWPGASAALPLLWMAIERAAGLAPTKEPLKRKLAMKLRSSRRRGKAVADEGEA